MTAPQTATPIVAIVGRPNVGKSALFNLIVGRRIAIVHEESGVTRDRIMAPGQHGDHTFTLVDTGGLGIGVRETRHVGLFDGLIRDQVAAIVEECTALIWVVDCQSGVTAQDEEVAALLRSAQRPVVLAANKADNDTLAGGAVAEFSRLGFDRIVPTSCTHRRGVDDLLDQVVESLPHVEGDTAPAPAMKLAVVGRPNVGKSSLVNRLFGAERVMVSDIAGTTRDAIDVPIVVRDGDTEVPMLLIDTAGLRRRSQVDTVVDLFSMMRTEHAIRRSDAVLMLLDATEPGTSQDRHIARMILDAGKPCVLLANKWDLAAAMGTKQREFEALVYERLTFMKHAPLQAICALSGHNLNRIFDHVLYLREQMRVMVPTSVFNQFLRDTLARNPPPAATTRRFKVFYGTMTGNPPPQFRLFANDREACPRHYLQFLENQIREAFFPQTGLPVRIEIREREDKSPGDGARRAAAGAQRQDLAERQAMARHRARKKGWRKRK
jgi:GTP-binding protein